MPSQRHYWDEKIIEWSTSGYKRDSKNISFIERIVYPLRKADKRYETAIELIAPIAKNKIILDLGFGVGDFSFGILRYHTKKVIGIDIADSAVEFVNKIAKKEGITDRVHFERGDVSEMKALPKSDIVIGLGFIDYLNKKQLIHLFKLIGKRSYFFSYFEKKFSMLNILHTMYVKYKHCPGSYKFTRSEMRKIVHPKTGSMILSKNNLIFITNIPNLKPLDWTEKL